MSGHSKWATTKRQKAVVDAKRGAIFTKIGKLVTIAARKGGDPATNFSLRIAMEKARSVNMPKENIERAIKRGAGATGEAQIEELIYEGLGPAKSQFIVKVLTDNKNKSAAEIRHLFSQFGGSLGAVMWNFSLRGVVQVEKQIINGQIKDQDQFELELIDAGAEDIVKEDEGITIYTKPEDLPKAKQFLEAKNIKTEKAAVEYVAKDVLDLSDQERIKVEDFINALEENEDIADYYTNVA